MKPPFTSPVLWLLIAATLTLGCEPASRSVGSGSHEETAGAKADPSSDGRPTDETEGLPGYLNDPKLITTAPGALPERVTVVGAASAVAEPGGAVSDVKVSVWLVSREELARLRSQSDSASGSTTIKGVKLAVLPVAADGSFKGDVKSNADSFLVFASVPVKGDELEVPANVPLDKVTLAAKDLSSGKPTFVFVMSLLEEFLASYRGALTGNPTCAVDLKHGCMALQRGPGLLVGAGKAIAEGGIDDCLERATERARHCSYPSDAPLAVIYDPATGDAPTILQTRTSARVRCEVSMTLACPAAPKAPQAYEDMSRSPMSEAQCARRAHELAAFCAGPDQQVTTRFIPMRGSETLTVGVAAQAPIIESRSDCPHGGWKLTETACHPVVKLVACMGIHPSPKFQHVLLTTGDQITCRELGYDGSFEIAHLLSEAGEGRAPLRRFSTERHFGLEQDSVSVGEASLGERWKAKEVLGYVLTSAPTDSRASVLYQCALTLDDSSRSLATEEKCGYGAEATSSALGVVFFGGGERTPWFLP